jgi:hypothetical protein
MLILIWAAIASGFGYDMVKLSMKGMLHFSLIVHIHVVVFIAWLVLFTLQILLVRTKNLALHKKWGLVSLGLIPLMIIFGVLAAFIVAKRDYGTPNSDLHFICIQFGNLLMFSCLAGVGLYLRKNYVVHKRLMLLATLVLTEPGFSRLIFRDGDFSSGYGCFWLVEVLPQLTLMLAIGVYDLVTRKQLHKAYVCGVLFFVLVTTIEVVLYFNDTWFILMKRMIGVA